MHCNLSPPVGGSMEKNLGGVLGVSQENQQAVDGKGSFLTR